MRSAPRPAAAAETHCHGARQFCHPSAGRRVPRLPRIRSGFFSVRMGGVCWRRPLRLWKATGQMAYCSSDVYDFSAGHAAGHSGLPALRRLQNCQCWTLALDQRARKVCLSGWLSRSSACAIHGERTTLVLCNAASLLGNFFAAVAAREHSAWRNDGHGHLLRVHLLVDVEHARPETGRAVHGTPLRGL